MAGFGSPCGACKFLRRKCVAGCVFAPFFRHEQGAAHFAAIHKVFGASNVAKLLMHLPVADRSEAAVTISYEAQARLQNPIYGCVAHIFALQQQVVNLQAQVASLEAQAARGPGNGVCQGEYTALNLHALQHLPQQRQDCHGGSVADQVAAGGTSSSKTPLPPAHLGSSTSTVGAEGGWNGCNFPAIELSTSSFDGGAWVDKDFPPFGIESELFSPMACFDLQDNYTWKPTSFQDVQGFANVGRS